MMADNYAPTPFRVAEAGAIRGGNIAHMAETGIGSNVHHLVIALNNAVAVRGTRYNPSLSLGDFAPGTGSTFSGFNQDQIFVNATGQIAFTGNTADSSNFGFWAGAPGALQLVGRHGSPAPGTSGNFSIGNQALQTGQLLAFNDAGQVAFNAGIEGAPPGTEDGVWAGAPGALQLVARTGSQAPGFATGVTWNYLSSIQLNSAGQVAVLGRVTQAPPTDTRVTDGYVLMAGAPGALQVIAKAGDPAPEAEPQMFLDLSDDKFCLNSAGQVALLTRFRPGKFGLAPSYTAICVGNPAGLKTVARSGQRAPGMDPDSVFLAFDDPVLNAAGEVAFACDAPSAALPVCKAVCAGQPGRLRKIARTNDVAPGTGGQLFGSFDDQGVLLSDSGQVAFLATYSPGGGVSGSGSVRGIFATDKSGTLHLIAREGAAIGGGPALTFLKLTGGSGVTGGEGSIDSKRHSFDREGRLIFYGWGNWFNPATGNTHTGKFIYRASFAGAAPVIMPVDQPAPVLGTLGGQATFTVNALGSRPATFQWRRDGVTIPGATSPTLTLSGLTVAQRGAYSVVVTNAQGSVTSAAATLTFPPVIAQPPVDRTLNAGQATSLEVTATGPGPFTYQWQFRAPGAADFADISGAASAILPLPNLTAGHAGRYRVLVTSADGTTTSSEARVTVAAGGAPLIKKIFVTGDPVTGIADTQFFRMVQKAVISNYGEIGFEGGLQGDTPGVGTGSYVRAAGGGYRYITRGGFNLNLSDSGVLAQLNSSPTTTIELGRPENMQPLASSNTSAPGGAGTYTNDGAYALDDGGRAVFRFGTNLSSSAIFFGQPGTTVLLAGRNRAAPGLPDGVQFDIPMDPVISPSGRVAFFSTLKGTGITTDNDTSLWQGTAADVQRMVSESDLVPAAGAGVRVGDIRFPDSRSSPFGWNEAGQVAFATTLAGTGITSSNDKALLAGTPNALAVVARDGVADGYTFDLSQRAYPLINRTGQVAFVAHVTPAGTGDYLQSLWLWRPGAGGGTRQLIAREGQPAPGLPAGVIMDSDTLGVPSFSFAMNGAGQLAVMTYLAGPGISYDAGNDRALYLTTPAGELKLVAQSNGMIDLGGGQMRGVGSLALEVGSGGEDGRPRALSESGEVLFIARLRREGSLGLDYGLFTARLASDTTALAAAYNAWAATAFPAGSTASVTAATADPDKDGMPNAIEYLMATSPVSPVRGTVDIQPSPGGIRITFPRRTDVPDGFEIIETTTDLGGPWIPVGRTAITRTGNGAGQPQTVTVTLPAGESARFVRVRAAAF